MKFFFSSLASLEECGRYLETIKVYENKPSDLIREQTDTDYLSRVHISEISFHSQANNSSFSEFLVLDDFFFPSFYDFSFSYNVCYWLKSFAPIVVLKCVTEDDILPSHMKFCTLLSLTLILKSNIVVSENISYLTLNILSESTLSSMRDHLSVLLMFLVTL